MARVKNTMQVIEESIKCVNGSYDMGPENIEDIRRASHDFVELISNGFYFGYMQGMRAARAEEKRGREGTIQD